MNPSSYDYAYERPKDKTTFVSKTIFLRLQSYGILPTAVGTNIYFSLNEMRLAKQRGIVVHAKDSHFYVAPVFLAEWNETNPGAFVLELKFWADEAEAAKVRGLQERTTHTRINEQIAKQY